MAVATVITNPKEAEGMIRWSLLFALAQGNDKLVLLHTDSVSEKEIRSHLDFWAEDFPTLNELEIEAMGPCIDEIKLLGAFDDLSASLLVLGQNRECGTPEEEMHALRKLFDKALCDSIILRLGNRRVDESDQVLVPTDGGPHSNLALKLASRLAKRHDGEIVPLFVESDIGEADGQAVGLRILGKFIDRAGLDRTDTEHIKPQIVVSNRLSRGIARAAKQKPYDLILLGVSNSKVVKRKLFGYLPAGVFEGDDAMTVALIRKRSPVGHRFRQRFERFLALKIPQLERGERIALFERLQIQSVWSFDFVTLILLSTGIASLGLIQSSPAVVIGAMLVAPLMTPLLGSGMSLVQGNLPLLRDCLKAIILGFLSALVFGGCVGCLAPITELTSELAARGGPNLLDFGVAALSGIAASYCVARPSLSSALAGVAIAAALVPPIATVGISTALREWENASGAALLFSTNVVAIILASAFTFFAMGIRGQVGAVTLWMRRMIVCLLVVLGVLLVPLTAVFFSKPVAASEAAVRQVLTAEGFAPVKINISNPSGAGDSLVLRCHLEAAQPVTQRAVNRLREKLQAKLNRDNLSLKVTTDLVIDSE